MADPNEWMNVCLSICTQWRQKPSIQSPRNFGKLLGISPGRAKFFATTAYEWFFYWGSYVRVAVIGCMAFEAILYIHTDRQTHIHFYIYRKWILYILYKNEFVSVCTQWIQKPYWFSPRNFGILLRVSPGMLMWIFIILRCTIRLATI